MKSYRKGLQIRKFVLLLLCFAFVFLAIPLSANNSTYAENFTGENRSDQNFSIVMTTKSRQNSALARVEKSAEQNETIKYLCFQWRDLEYLQFRFDKLVQDTTQFGEYEFKVTYFRDDRLLPILDSEPETLFRGQVGDFTRKDFYYYIDQNSAPEQSPTNSSGNGYGLYKFDFVYWRMISEKLEPVAATDSFYVAVLPDQNIEELLAPVQDLRIVYSVSSANRLLNKFNLFLSSDVLKYVKPDRITWLAYGDGIDNNKYVITQQMQDLDIRLANRIVVWENLDTTRSDLHGDSYMLDTKDIEGTWEADCIISNAEGEEVLRLHVDKLSTIKVPPKSYLWLILLILALILLILFIISLIVILIMKKREKVW